MTLPKIGIFVVQFPKLSETFIVTKLLKLLDAGFDVQVFTLVESRDWDKFAILDDRADVRNRVHIVPPLEPAWRVATRGAAELARTAILHPRKFAQYLEHNWRTRNETQLGFIKSVYQRSHFITADLDILHIEFDMQGIGVADLRDFLNCRVLLSSRGTFQHSSVADRMPDALEYLFRHADGYHFISHYLADNTHRLGLPLDVPTWLVEPAIDLTLFRPPVRAPRNGPLRLISVGRVDWMKGYEFALDAVARVRAAGVPIEYTIYGDGPYMEPVRSAIDQLGLTGHVRLAGAVGREEMPAAYAAADIMVHAALHEGFCNAVIEAQAMELPVVTSSAGGLPENVSHGETGFVVPTRDPEEMATRIVELARDPELRARFGRAGRMRATARFDLDRQATAFVELYKQLHASPRRMT